MLNNDAETPFEIYIETELDLTPLEKLERVPFVFREMVAQKLDVWLKIGPGDNWWIWCLTEIHDEIHRQVSQSVITMQLPPEEKIYAAISLAWLVYNDFVDELGNDEKDTS